MDLPLSSSLLQAAARELRRCSCECMLDSTSAGLRLRKALGAAAEAAVIGWMTAWNIVEGGGAPAEGGVERGC